MIMNFVNGIYIYIYIYIYTVTLMKIIVYLDANKLSIARGTNDKAVRPIIPSVLRLLCNRVGNLLNFGCWLLS